PGEARASCAHGKWPLLTGLGAVVAEPFRRLDGNDHVVNRRVVAELVVWRVAAVAEYNHVGLRRVAALAHLTGSCVVIAAIWASAPGRGFGGRVEVGRTVNPPSGLGLGALHGEFLR